MAPIIHHMPDGTPAPAIMTTDEVIRFLRLNEIAVKRPEQTIDYYRQRGLPALQLGRAVRFRLEDVVEWVGRLPRK